MIYKMAGFSKKNSNLKKICLEECYYNHFNKMKIENKRMHFRTYL